MTTSRRFSFYQTQHRRTMFHDQPDILSTEEVCELLRVGKDTVYALLEQGALKGYRSGRLWRIPKQAVEEYIVRSARLRPL